MKRSPSIMAFRAAISPLAAAWMDFSAKLSGWWLSRAHRSVTSFGGYPTFNYHVNGYGGRLVTTPYLDDHEKSRRSARSRYQGKCAAGFTSQNPDNPMGSWWDANEVLTFAKALPENLSVDSGRGLLRKRRPRAPFPSVRAMIGMPNVLRMRTFSKAYGLAGARVGYAIGTLGNAEAFDKIRNHFGMSRVFRRGSACSPE